MFETFVAFVAHEPPAVAVLRLSVVNQATGMLQHLFALLARVFLRNGTVRIVLYFLVVLQHVQLQAVRVRELSVALLARKGLFLVVDGTSMYVQVLFANEGLAALVAFILRICGFRLCRFG